MARRVPKKKTLYDISFLQFCGVFPCLNGKRFLALQAGNDYLSVAINFGAGEIRANAVKTDTDGEYRFIPYSN